MKQAVDISEAAAARLKELAGSPPAGVLRLSVKGAGCGGNKYDLAKVDGPGPADERVEKDGAELYVEAKSLIHLLGTRIDWVEDGMGSSFRFENPNETSRCGCGESFSTR